MKTRKKTHERDGPKPEDAVEVDPLFYYILTYPLNDLGNICVFTPLSYVALLCRESDYSSLRVMFFFIMYYVPLIGPFFFPPFLFRLIRDFIL